ncbi:hypothetical protein [Sphingomonas sp.]|uniref:hypothetical protein n=1 Tax=Sphingomonas sp. TaxID=28214 RepID=UPI0038ACA64F
MRKSFALLGGAALLAACGRSGDTSANQAAAQHAQPKKKPAHCFFKPSEMKGWATSRDKDGNVVVKGKAYRSDARYKALLGPPEVSGTVARIAPTITVNDGYAAPEDWWDVSATIPNSGAIDTVTVTCGATTVAELKPPPRV